jgi:hypothetical protein
LEIKKNQLSDWLQLGADLKFSFRMANRLLLLRLNLLLVQMGAAGIGDIAQQQENSPCNSNSQQLELC